MLLMAKRAPIDLDEQQHTKRLFNDYGLAAAEFMYPENTDTTSDADGSTRFNFITDKEVKNLSTLQPPKTTFFSTNWALSEWMKSRNEKFPHNKVPENILDEGNPEDLNNWLSYYVNETRNCKGELYPPKTLYQLLSGLLRHTRTFNARAPNFLDKTNPIFKPLHAVLDNLFKSLRKEGVGCNSKHAEIITKEEESMLWGSNVINLSHPKGLLRAVFYYNGKNFCLRGGVEHRYLKLSQFTRYSDHYIYTENASKNRQGGLAQLRMENKTVPIYSRDDAGERCHVHILDKYIQKLPEEVIKQDYFYARPLLKVPSDPNEPWYASVPVGKNVLGSMLKDMCREAHISGHKTNHSLRATGASELFEAGVPKKIIKERTGHRSLEALRLYERTTSDQQKAVSSILSADKKTTYKDAIDQQKSIYSQQYPEFPVSSYPSPMNWQQQSYYSYPVAATTIQPYQVFNNCSITFNYPGSLSAHGDHSRSSE